MNSFELNFDGLVGPSHNYAGLSSGNIASTQNSGKTARPKKAAKQGLRKMKHLFDLGFYQGILAPHCRPDFSTLRRLGFSGPEKEIINKVAKYSPELLATCYSASSMWSANAATISPSADTEDGKVHLTPANLNSKFHRSLEPLQTAKILKATFSDKNIFEHHLHLPEGKYFSDEGAANHTRFCSHYGTQGVEFFVYGRNAFKREKPRPQEFEARQTREASEAIARLHKLSAHKTVFAQQNPKVIDSGIFHNDVISVGNQNLYFYHQEALLNTQEVLQELREKFDPHHQFYTLEVPTKEVSVKDAVDSYLFNAQILSRPNGDMLILVPEECQQNSNVWNFLKTLPEKRTPLKEVLVFNVTESMKNGGGPACLRLRVPLKENEIKGINPHTLLNQSLYNKIDKWIDKHYRDELSPHDLRDPNLIDEIREALDELTQIMDLGSIYPFQ